MRIRSLLIGLFILALVSSLVLNYFLYLRARDYYLQLNRLRLDPLDLSTYSTEPELHQQPTVMFYGDSRAASWPVPDRMENLKFINRGIGAQTTAQVLQRYDYHVTPIQPEIILIQVGVNDLKTIPLFPENRNWIINQTQENIRTLVERSGNTTIILTTIFPVGDVPLERRPFWSDDVGVAVQEVNAYIVSLTAENVIVFDTFSLLADSSGTLRPEYSQDELHLNTAGYGVLNVELANILTSLMTN